MLNGAGKLVSGRCWSIERGRAGSGFGEPLISSALRLSNLWRVWVWVLVWSGNGGMAEGFGGGGGGLLAFHVCRRRVSDLC